MNHVMNQAVFGSRPIRDAATGKIALITQNRNLRAFARSDGSVLPYTYNRNYQPTTKAKIPFRSYNKSFNKNRRTRAMGEWDDTFKSVTSGVANLTNSISNIIGSIKGNTTNINPNTGGYPMQQMYYGQQPYYGVNPMIPSYNYPAQQPQYVAPKTNNTLLYTGLGVAALAGLIFLKNK